MKKERPLGTFVLILAASFFLSFILLPTDSAGIEAPIISGKQQMLKNQQQVLSIMNYQTGHNYTWAITSGLGQLNPLSGERVTYTAPSTNPNCVNNPTIQVCVEGGGCGDFEIAVSAYPSAGGPPSYEYYFCPFEQAPSTIARGNAYNCRGEFYYQEQCGNHYVYWPSMGLPCDTVMQWMCPGHHPGDMIDFRTQQMKDQGCCVAPFVPDYDELPPRGPSGTPDDVYCGTDNRGRGVKAREAVRGRAVAEQAVRARAVVEQAVRPRSAKV
jgi:hypothetical protein